MTEPIDSHQIKANMKKAYDEISPFYLKWTESSHATRLSYVDIMLKSINTQTGTHQKSILELGCGAGVPVTQLLASQEHTSVTANDISETQIALAKERLPASVDLIQGDMMNLGFGHQQFDAVLGMYSISHIPRDEQTVLLTRIFDWLKPGGQLLANFPETNFEGSTNESWLGATNGAVYWSSWGREKLVQVLRDIGFDIKIDEVVVDSEETDGVSRDVPFHWILAKK
ncbi:Methyltransferase type 11 [Penicillium angulare]|uniref:Methyltransferase type 11 n=1 Tax=Penicillium angulare TaxID=116970 RepID=UPI002540D05A|nr:Methyltransferase type 11 [Penicillium angulare]KAJ5280036.1 Methyltransferase type 11 [Penicillium angulare]